MRLKGVLISASFAITFLLLPATLEAQFRGRGGYGGDRGRSFDPTEMLRNMDTNKNGMIDPNEMASNRAAFFVRGAAQRAGMDLTKPLAIDKLAEAMQRGREERSRDGDNGRDSRDGDRNRDDRRRDDERRSDQDRPASSSSPGSGSGSQTAGSGPAPAAGVVGFGTPAATGGSVAGFSSGSLEQRFEPRVINYVEDMLKRYDKNNDGYVDSEEWKTGTWSTKPEESDLNKDNRLSKEELCIRIAKRFGSQSPGSSSSAASTGSSVSGSSAGDSEQVRRYAESLLRQYDKNGDGKLEREEWSSMLSQHHSADTNGDGTITKDELAARLASYAGSSSSASGSSSGGSSDGSQVGRVRRFRTPAERLPAGLPNWFLEKDADQDGQIRMSEYATLWSDATAAEFALSDLNGDGIITAKECLKAATPK